MRIVSKACRTTCRLVHDLKPAKRRTSPFTLSYPSSPMTASRRRSRSSRAEDVAAGGIVALGCSDELVDANQLRRIMPYKMLISHYELSHFRRFEKAQVVQGLTRLRHSSNRTYHEQVESPTYLEGPPLRTARILNQPLIRKGAL